MPERLISSETEKPSPVYVFDLDGVITDPENSQVDEDVVNAMYELLAEGTYLVVNTGRSYDWVEQNLINRFETRNNPDIFNRFISVCEKGGETVSWHDGQHDVQPSEFALPHDNYDIAHMTFDRHAPQLPTMFWDETKRTMATIEKVANADLKTFRAEQAILVDKLREAFGDRDVRIDPTVIATDVESPAAGKYAGARVIYQWVRSVIGSENSSFISIGDSTSDYEMARFFAEQRAESTFVYVGEPTNEISEDERVKFIATKNRYSAGALEFLSHIGLYLPESPLR